MKKIAIILLALILVGCQSDVKAQNKEALKHMRQGNYTEALNVLKEVLMEWPDDDTTWNNVSVCYDAIGEYELALEAAQNAVSLGKEKAAEYTNLGNAYYDLGDTESARLAYTKALDLDDEHFFALFGMGIYFTGEEDYEEAMVYFQDLYDNNPMNEDVVSYIAYCQFKMGKIDASIAFLEEQLSKVSSAKLEEILEQIKNSRKLD